METNLPPHTYMDNITSNNETSEPTQGETGVLTQEDEYHYSNAQKKAQKVRSVIQRQKKHNSHNAALLTILLQHINNTTVLHHIVNLLDKNVPIHNIFLLCVPCVATIRPTHLTPGILTGEHISNSTSTPHQPLFAPCTLDEYLAYIPVCLSHIPSSMIPLYHTFIHALIREYNIDNITMLSDGHTLLNESLQEMFKHINQHSSME